jgi:hypothetical protein
MSNREIVRNMYKEIFTREPDEFGLNHYENLLNTNKLSIDSFRNELLNSYEFAVIKLHRIYNEIFGRSADSLGISVYANRLQSKQIDENGLKNELRKSNEYIQIKLKELYQKIFGIIPEQKILDKYLPLIQNNIVSFENIEKIFNIQQKISKSN